MRWALRSRSAGRERGSCCGFPLAHHSTTAKIPRDGHPALAIVGSTDLSAPISFVLSCPLIICFN